MTETDRRRVMYDSERRLPLALRPWRPFRSTPPVNPDGSQSELEPNESFWANAHYLVHRAELGEGEYQHVHLSMRTVENDARHDWREMMRVKDELAGEDWEAVELYPAKERVVDTANQYHLFCFPPGTPGHQIIGSIGFHAGRHVYGPDDKIPESFLQGQPVPRHHVQRPLGGEIERPPRRVAFNVTHGWESQAPQYRRSDITPPLMGGIIHWQVPKADSQGIPVHCLLFYGTNGELLGILNYFPEGSPVGDEPHDTLTLVRPDMRRKGIGTALLREAMRRWPEVDLLKQSYTDEGWSLARSVLEAQAMTTCPDESCSDEYDDPDQLYSHLTLDHKWHDGKADAHVAKTLGWPTR